MTRTILAMAMAGVLLLASVAASALEISIDEQPTTDGPNFYTVWLSGRITPDDSATLDKLFRARGLVVERPPKPGTLWVHITSPGGSVYAAMKIGTLLRNLNSNVFAKGDCMSSCVLVLAGGLMKDAPKGRVGIHRPFLADISDGATYKDVKAMIAKSRADISTYLDAMNVNPRLVDDMYAIPPEQVQILSKSDLTKYGLNQMDPIVSEMGEVLRAKQLGISREEFLRRKARVNQQCLEVVNKYKGLDSAPIDACVNDVLSGRR